MTNSVVDNDDFQRASTSRHHHKHRRGCCGYMEKFDNFCMKPIFIYKYTRQAEKEMDDFANDFTQDGGKIVENEFGS